MKAQAQGFSTVKGNFLDSNFIKSEDVCLHQLQYTHTKVKHPSLLLLLSRFSMRFRIQNWPLWIWKCPFPYMEITMSRYGIHFSQKGNRFVQKGILLREILPTRKDFLSGRKEFHIWTLWFPYMEKDISRSSMVSFESWTSLKTLITKVKHLDA